MLRIVSIAAALATSTMLLGATASHAQTTGYYVAVPVAKPTRTSFMANETIWNWNDSAYVARRGSDRDAIQCQVVARKAGKLTAFTAGGAAFDAAALDKCNAKAK